MKHIQFSQKKIKSFYTLFLKNYTLYRFIAFKYITYKIAHQIIPISLNKILALLEYTCIPKPDHENAAMCI